MMGLLWFKNSLFCAFFLVVAGSTGDLLACSYVCLFVFVLFYQFLFASLFRKCDFVFGRLFVRPSMRLFAKSAGVDFGSFSCACSCVRTSIC